MKDLSISLKAGLVVLISTVNKLIEISPTQRIEAKA